VIVFDDQDAGQMVVGGWWLVAVLLALAARPEPLIHRKRWVLIVE
jgi:hypothetical protein